MGLVRWLLSLLQALLLLYVALLHLLGLLLVSLLKLLRSCRIEGLFGQILVFDLVLLLKFLALLILCGVELLLLLLVSLIQGGIARVWRSGPRQRRKLVGMDRRARCIERTRSWRRRHRGAALVDGGVQVPIGARGLHMLRLHRNRWDVPLARE